MIGCEAGPQHVTSDQVLRRLVPGWLPSLPTLQAALYVQSHLRQDLLLEVGSRIRVKHLHCLVRPTLLFGELQYVDRQHHQATGVRQILLNALQQGLESNRSVLAYRIHDLDQVLLGSGDGAALSIQSAPVHHFGEVDLIELRDFLQDGDLDQKVVLGCVLDLGDESEHFAEDVLGDVLEGEVVTFNLGVLGHQ